MDQNKIWPEEIRELPVLPFLDTICSTLKNSDSRFIVISAQTAAGKSTAIPIALLRQFRGKIYILEPRRLAVLAVANRIAHLLGEETGNTAGYRMHLESKVGKNTRLIVMTEAVLTRLLQQDPELSGVSVVVIDEFHERSVNTDLSIAFLKDSMALRNDLYGMVMSATLDTEPLAQYLGNHDTDQIIPAPVITIPGRQFPVFIEYKPEYTPAEAVRYVLQTSSDGGSILVFLPGLADIVKTRKLLSDYNSESIEIFILHSTIPFTEQQKLLTPSQDKIKRRIILSSAIAETSITVPDVTTVIDSGLARINRIDIRTGMNHLCTENENIFNANQRAGRAGRTAPGKCIRLWAEYDVRNANMIPEIQRADLTQLVLECAVWGIRKPDRLMWLTPPPAGSWEYAVTLLKQLGCINDSGQSTSTGKKCLSTGLHPRLACVVLAGLALNVLPQAIDIVIQYSEYRDAAPHIQKKLIEDLHKRLNYFYTPSEKSNLVPPALLLLSGFPDRICRTTGLRGEYQFPSGRKALLQNNKQTDNTHIDPLWIVAPDTDAGSTTGRIYAFEPLSEHEALSWLESRSTTIITSELSGQDVETLRSGKKLVVKKTEYTIYGKLVLKEIKREVNHEDFINALSELIKKEGSACLPLTAGAENLLTRIRFFINHNSNSAELKDKFFNLAATSDEWLKPFLPDKITTVDGTTVETALRWYLDGDTIDHLVPQKITLKNGKTFQLTYDNTENPRPALEVIIQQLFGCFETPQVLGVPVLLKLLSPARRPLQITDDLDGFWKHTWPEVCKEMKGRYPKHKWDYRVIDE